MRSNSKAEPPQSRRAVAVEVLLHGADDWIIPRAGLLAAQARRILLAEGAEGPVHIVFQDESAQRELNRQWRSLDRTTDVLSFHYGEPELFGELYIDPKLARKQAARLGHGAYREFRRLITHGCLHLCGYDHIRAADRVVMRRLEDRYDPPPPSRARTRRRAAGSRA